MSVQHKKVIYGREKHTNSRNKKKNQNNRKDKGEKNRKVKRNK